MSRALPSKDELLEATTQFEGLAPKPNKPLCLPDLKSGELDEERSSFRSYLLDLLKSDPVLRDAVGSPIFHFVVEQADQPLSAGAKKWVGAIPREISAAETQAFAEQAANKLVEAEKKRLELDEEECRRLKKILRNTLISCLHSGLKTVEHAPALNAALDGKTNFISYKDLEEKARQVFNEMSSGEMAEDELSEDQMDEFLLTLLKRLGVLASDAAGKEQDATIELINTAKSRAWTLYQQLGENIQKAQRRAQVSGEIAKVDFHGEHINLHFMEHLRAMYGASDAHGKTPEDRFELQTAANLTWLMARLLTHPVYRTLSKYKDSAVRDFTKKVYGGASKLFVKNVDKKTLFLDERMRQTTPANAKYTDNYEVYDSQLPGFDDLPRGMRQIYRGEKLFREKEALSIFIKSMREKNELGNIPDLLAGEAVCMGIRESDLDPSQNEIAEKAQQFMIAQARAIAEKTGLQEDTSTCHYTKIPRGSYRIEVKMGKKEKNKQSFNFPSVKIYMNVPVNQSQSIRMEYRLICGDTWLRGNKQEDSMSHHELYKLKQVVELLDILTARVYNGRLHPVASQIREWIKVQERQELAELNEQSA